MSKSSTSSKSSISVLKFSNSISLQPLIRKHSYLDHRYPVGSMRGRGGGFGGKRSKSSFNGALLTAYLYVAIPLLLPHKKGTN